MKRTINGKTFEKIGYNYVHEISKKHAIIIQPSGKFWIAFDSKVEGFGKYMDGTKNVRHRQVAVGSTLKKALAGYEEWAENQAADARAIESWGATPHVPLNPCLKAPSFKSKW